MIFGEINFQLINECIYHLKIVFLNVKVDNIHARNVTTLKNSTLEAGGGRFENYDAQEGA